MAEKAATKTKRQVQRKPSAVKRARQSAARHERNVMHETKVRTQIKKLRAALAGKNKEESRKLLVPTLSLIAKVAGKGIFHRNTAARYTSRLQRQFNAL